MGENFFRSRRKTKLCFFHKMFFLQLSIIQSQLKNKQINEIGTCIHKVILDLFNFITIILVYRDRYNDTKKVISTFIV